MNEKTALMGDTSAAMEGPAPNEAVVRRDSAASSNPAARAHAFGRLADRHLVASYRLARAILGDAAEAEDATHDAFLVAWQKWSTLREPARFEHWFHRIVVNTCRNRLRRRARWQIRDISADVGLCVEDASAATGDRDVLGQALLRLNPDQRVILALRFHQDLTVDEIAGVLSIRSGTVKSRLHYALARLHQVLDESDAREVLR